MLLVLFLTPKEAELINFRSLYDSPTSFKIKLSMSSKSISFLLIFSSIFNAIYLFVLIAFEDNILGLLK